jgi:hypothetical protein
MRVAAPLHTSCRHGSGRILGRRLLRCCCSWRAGATWLLGLLLALGGPSWLSAFAQQSSLSLRPTGARLERLAAGPLGMLGLAAIPDGTASDIRIERGEDGSTGLLLGQLGTGFTLSESFPLYLEGSIGYARYDPLFAFTDGQQRRRLPLRWNTAAATLGVGWSFSLNERLQLRPVFNASLGYIGSDLTVGARFLDWATGIDLDALKRGEATVGGLGGAMVLGWYDYRPQFEFEAELRYSQMRFETLPQLSRGLAVRADAATLGLWTRLRWPTGVEAFGRPVRWVLDGQHSEFLMDQRRVLGIDRLTRLGGGLELDVGRWEAGAFGLYLQRIRLMGHAVVGEDVRGWSVGLGISF